VQYLGFCWQDGQFNGLRLQVRVNAGDVIVWVYFDLFERTDVRVKKMM
jgi:hypothetical protein